jgi:hypothetical protein
VTDKEKFIEKEVAEKEKKMKLDVRNRSVVRYMAAKEWHFWERETVRIDNHNSHDDVEAHHWRIAGKSCDEGHWPRSPALSRFKFLTNSIAIKQADLRFILCRIRLVR